MGQDERESVVDKRLKVHGLAGLRIVDASIFPNVTSGNTHAAVLMVAEKGADLILQDV
jgi:choline dehydrogenase